MTIRPRRSVLYMPGSNARAIEKARTLPADAVILDLEDSVAPDGLRRQQVMGGKAGGFVRRWWCALTARHAVAFGNLTAWASRARCILVPRSHPDQLERSVSGCRARQSRGVGP
jgi:citrate lyase subunit beta/citryl-CoA lyase